MSSKQIFNEVLVPDTCISTVGICTPLLPNLFYLECTRRAAAAVLPSSGHRRGLESWTAVENQWRAFTRLVEKKTSITLPLCSHHVAVNTTLPAGQCPELRLLGEPT